MDGFVTKYFLLCPYFLKNFLRLYYNYNPPFPFIPPDTFRYPKEYAQETLLR